ncbi:ZIP zinc/iron transport family [Sistotremastrum niveocremeum HHB9708]|uniref:ZIP zinc/iron transport family n=1 Tax=Sistotremastrum niveocremeum HHB9708 TaxID=1314777 RepID=A0A164W0G0_9AGAM|nr:ZIP zinc/iron transport family [Sistotremastrum niveocremeum HHB9708]
MSATNASLPSTPTPTPPPSDDDLNCGDGGGSDSHFHLRIASIFIIMAMSMFGALFPVIAKRIPAMGVPKIAFEFAKYFGSGVIIATAFIHLLDPAIEELSNPCLGGTWQLYPWALALSMLAVFSIFIVELMAFRFGTQYLEKRGIAPNPHGHGIIGTARAGHSHDDEPGAEIVKTSSMRAIGDVEKPGSETSEEEPSNVLDTPLAQIVGIAILEFGVLLHSVLIGLTLAVDPDFITLFIVIIFHQTFEGLGLGSRLAFLALPPSYNYVPIVGALLYGLTTPIGIAAGLGIRTTYNPNSTKASIVSGILDALSSGILLYTGLVELLAHEFLFNPAMHQASTKKLCLSLLCMIAGAGIMALLGRWA